MYPRWKFFWIEVKSEVKEKNRSSKKLKVAAMSKTRFAENSFEKPELNKQQELNKLVATPDIS